MSYRYKSGYGWGFDILISTPKSEIQGICIPLYSGARLMTGFNSYINELMCNVYIAKHCDNINEFTHVSPQGFVNRFGWFLTEQEVSESIDIGQGWFKRKRVQSLKDIDAALEKLFGK